MVAVPSSPEAAPERVPESPGSGGGGFPVLFLFVVPFLFPLSVLVHGSGRTGVVESDGDDRDRCRADDPFGDAPEDEPVDPPAAVGPHHDAVDTPVASDANDLPTRSPVHGRRLQVDLVVEQLLYLPQRGLALSVEDLPDPLPGGLHRQAGVGRRVHHVQRDDIRVVDSGYLPRVVDHPLEPR